MSFAIDLINDKITSSQEYILKYKEYKLKGSVPRIAFLQDDSETYKYLYNQASNFEVYDVSYEHNPNEISEKRIQKPYGVLSKYSFKILKSFIGSFGEVYLYNLSEKKHLKSEIADLINRENDAPANVKIWLKSFLNLVDKSLSFPESTIIIEYEV